MKALSWAGYVAHVREKRSSWRVSMRKREGDRRTCIWEDDNKMNLEQCDGVVSYELIWLRIGTNDGYAKTW